ncbi:hypothetical protein NDU88_011423 [Pleurodeles waltl]|uniref:Uncharacterized protein n=1 Tax=Pleurodeles waltl TaxID=8319 RepID=A0AAV7QX69_PLEWA|nr:hypothetical protein NDU88_011423 [Pleurodeles waltl]
MGAPASRPLLLKGHKRSVPWAAACRVVRPGLKSRESQGVPDGGENWDRGCPAKPPPARGRRPVWTPHWTLGTAGDVEGLPGTTPGGARRDPKLPEGRVTVGPPLVFPSLQTTSRRRSPGAEVDGGCAPRRDNTRHGVEGPGALPVRSVEGLGARRGQWSLTGPRPLEEEEQLILWPA